jgi:hypothetical protein
LELPPHRSVDLNLCWRTSAPKARSDAKRYQFMLAGLGLWDKLSTWCLWNHQELHAEALARCTDLLYPLLRRLHG